MNNNEYKPRHASGVFKPWPNAPREGGHYVVLFTILTFVITVNAWVLNIPVEYIIGALPVLGIIFYFWYWFASQMK